jgi:D-alanine-D-alanine ligase
MEYHVIQTLRGLGHKVRVLGVGSDIVKIINELSQQRPDLVFNLTEEFGGDRRQDKNIAAVLEMLDMPFTGTGSLGLMLCRDKMLCKQLLSLHRIRVPGFISVPLNQSVRPSKSICFPLVVKPAFEDSSEGISNASLVKDFNALKERVEFVHQRWSQAAIAEEYIDGRELYVSIIGNSKLEVFPIRECFFSSQTGDGPLMATYRVKWNKQYREKWNIEFGFAELEKKVVTDIERICKRAYRILNLRDYGRIDLKLTSDNRIVILEANPNPDIAYGEEVAESAEKIGISYGELIERILHLALLRYG